MPVHVQRHPCSKRCSSVIIKNCIHSKDREIRMIVHEPFPSALQLYIRGENKEGGGDELLLSGSRA